MNKNRTFWQGSSTSAIDARINTLQENLRNARNSKERERIRRDLETARTRKDEIISRGPVNQDKPLNRVNPNNPREVANAANNQYREDAQTAFNINNPDQYTAYGSQEVTFDKDGKPIIRQNLAPEEQQRLAGERQRDDSINRISSDLMGDISARRGYDPRQNIQDIETQDYRNSPDVRRFNNQGLTPLADLGRERRGLPGLDNDFEGSRGRVEDDLYNRRTKRLDEQFSRANEDFEQSLADRGINPGTPLYQRMRDDFETNKRDAYSEAQSEAIQRGGEEQTRLNTMRASNRAQLFGEAVSSAQQDLAGRQQEVTERSVAEASDVGAFERDQATKQRQFDQSMATRDRQYNENMNYQNTPLQQLGSIMQHYQGTQKPQFAVGYNEYQKQLVDYPQIYQNRVENDIRREEIRSRNRGQGVGYPVYNSTNPTTNTTPSR